MSPYTPRTDAAIARSKDPIEGSWSCLCTTAATLEIELHVANECVAGLRATIRELRGVYEDCPTCPGPYGSIREWDEWDEEMEQWRLKRNKVLELVSFAD